MSMLRLLGLVLTFGLLGGLVRAADEPAEKKADDPQTNAAKSPSDKSAAKDDRFRLSRTTNTMSFSARSPTRWTRSRGTTCRRSIGMS
jgi:hypothetical protein